MGVAIVLLAILVLFECYFLAVWRVRQLHEVVVRRPLHHFRKPGCRTAMTRTNEVLKAVLNEYTGQSGWVALSRQARASTKVKLARTHQTNNP